jgi:phosphoribosylformylglycinamidine cyclo-ligase
MYGEGDYDLAGFCVGVVEKEGILDGSKVSAGDRLIGLASSGPHSNGYSLIRKVLEVSGASLNDALGNTNQTIGEALLAPTRIYVKPLLELMKNQPVHALAHITGGGLTENLPRVMPEYSMARIDARSWHRPAVFNWLQDQGGIEDEEMLRTFNCGIGMVIVVPESAVNVTREQMNQHGIDSWEIGKIEACDCQAPCVEFS